MRDEARAGFREALEHFTHRRYREALRGFERVHRLAPSADLWFNIARCHEELGNPELAAEHLRRYLRDRVDAPDRSEVERRIEGLVAEARGRAAIAGRPQTGSLRILTAGDASRVSVDGRHLSRTVLSDAVVMPPGDHRVDVTLEGRVPFRARVSVYPRALTRAHVEQPPLTTYETVDSGRPWTWAIASIAAAAAAVGGTTAVAAVAGGCDGAGCDRIAEYSLAGAVVTSVAAVAAAFLESGHETRSRSGVDLAASK